MTSRWTRGEADIDRLLAQGWLEPIGRSASDGGPLLERASRTLQVARAALEIDLDTAYTNAYDAARLAGTALLIQQGLRPTTTGGHRAVEQALIAQFGKGFGAFSVMRRRRHELEYPDSTYAETSHAEAEQAIQTTSQFIAAAESLLPQLGFYASQ